MILLMSFAAIAGTLLFCSVCAVALLVVVLAIASFESNPVVKENRNTYRGKL